MFRFRIFFKIRFKVRVRVRTIFRVSVMFMVSGRVRLRVMVGLGLGLGLVSYPKVPIAKLCAMVFQISPVNNILLSPWRKKFSGLWNK